MGNSLGKDNLHMGLMQSVLPGGTNGEEPACQGRRGKRCRFDHWVRKIPWRRAWQPTPVFLSGESYGQRSLEGYSPLGCEELNTTAHMLIQTNSGPHMCWPHSSKVTSGNDLVLGPEGWEKVENTRITLS